MTIQRGPPTGKLSLSRGPACLAKLSFGLYRPWTEGCIQSTRRNPLIGRPLWLPDGSGLLAVIRDAIQGRGQVWYISYPSGESRRVTNDLGDYALSELDLTRDGKSLVAVESTISSDLWVVRGDDAVHAKQITSGRNAVRGISVGPKQTIVFVNQKGDLYSIDDDGRALELLTPNMHDNGNPSACRDGRHIVFESTSARAEEHLENGRRRLSCHAVNAERECDLTNVLSG